MKQSGSWLGELAIMQHRINESEKLILQRAETRLDEINTLIQKIRPAALDHSQEYTDLIKERGQLHMIISQSREILTGNSPS